MPDGSHGSGSDGTKPERRLVLELVICGLEPLSGQVGLASTVGRIPFRGWIDLMSAIHTICDEGTGLPPAPP